MQARPLVFFFLLFESSRRLPVLQTLRSVRGGQTVANNVLPILVLFDVRFKCASVEKYLRMKNQSPIFVECGENPVFSPHLIVFLASVKNGLC